MSWRRLLVRMLKVLFCYCQLALLMLVSFVFSFRFSIFWLISGHFNTYLRCCFAGVREHAGGSSNEEASGDLGPAAKKNKLSGRQFAITSWLNVCLFIYYTDVYVSFVEFLSNGMIFDNEADADREADEQYGSQRIMFPDDEAANEQSQELVIPNKADEEEDIDTAVSVTVHTF